MRVTTLYNGVRLVGRPCPANVERLDMGAMPLILDMQRNGVLIDQGHFRGLHTRLLARLAEIDADLEQQSEGWRPRKGQPLNFGSPDQVAELLYDHLRVHRDRPSAVKLTAGGKLSTGDEFLSLFKRVHPCVGLILERRQVTKLVSTYVLPLPKMAAEQGGRVHTEFVSTRTATGRYSSRNPNCQNIPARSALGLEVRNGFVAPPGYSLVSHDLSQIEMRLAAALSGDAMMRSIFARGLDIHNITAVQIFRLDPARIDHLAAGDAANTLTADEAVEWKRFKHEMRLPCKTLGFGILYGVTPEGLQLQIAAADGPWWETAECERLINQWYEVYGGIRAYMDREHQRARRYRVAWDLFGRSRGIPEVRAASQSVVNAGLRMTGNHGIQATAAGILKLAMAWVKRELIPMFPEGAVRPLLTVHDELIAEVRNDCVADYLEAGKYPMESLVPLPNGVRIVSSADSAERWGELK